MMGMRISRRKHFHFASNRAAVLIRAALVGVLFKKTWSFSAPICRKEPTIRKSIRRWGTMQGDGHQEEGGLPKVLLEKKDYSRVHSFAEMNAVKTWLLKFLPSSAPMIKKLDLSIQGSEVSSGAAWAVDRLPEPQAVAIVDPRQGRPAGFYEIAMFGLCPDTRAVFAAGLVPDDCTQLQVAHLGSEYEHPLAAALRRRGGGGGGGEGPLVLDWKEPCGLFVWEAAAAAAAAATAAETTGALGGAREGSRAGGGGAAGAAGQEMVELGPLQPGDAETVNSCWKYRSPSSLAMIQSLIETQPTCGLRYNGELVSWMCTYHDGAIGMLYTKGHMRRKGYGKQVLQYMIKEHRSQIGTKTSANNVFFEEESSFNKNEGFRSQKKAKTALSREETTAEGTKDKRITDLVGSTAKGTMDKRITDLAESYSDNEKSQQIFSSTCEGGGGDDNDDIDDRSDHPEKLKLEDVAPCSTSRENGYRLDKAQFKHDDAAVTSEEKEEGERKLCCSIITTPTIKHPLSSFLPSIPFCFIVDGNTASSSLFEQEGFQRHSDASWLYFKSGITEKN